MPHGNPRHGSLDTGLHKPYFSGTWQFLRFTYSGALV